MELNVNSNCELTLDGVPEVSGLEVIVHNDEVITIDREMPDYWETTLTEDGLYEYYILNFNEDEPEDLIKYITENSYTPVQSVFSICQLRKCLLNREKDYIKHFLSSCSGSVANCGKQSDNSTMADFLLASIFVLEQLICCGNFDEAKRILNIINNDNCGLCGEDKKTTKDCNCGKSN